MALVLLDRVQQTGTANTTVSFTLSGSVTGFQSFAGIGNGNTTYYAGTDVSGNWEAGLGTYSTTGPTLTRTTILASSNAGSAVTFSGAVNVFVTYPSEKGVWLDASGNVSPLGIVASGTWQASTIATLYGGTGVTVSTGANSNVLRDANQNITANNFFVGYASTVSSATTLTLTVASAQYQRISGTAAQTVKLPNATTLQNGFIFTIDNDSSLTATVIDSASTTLDTIPSGGVNQWVLIDNGTVAGTWVPYSQVPSAVDWGTNTLNLATTVVSGGTWNGGTITSAYGGTGLTTFTAANNALYSTSAGALAAGTLPIAAGGTASTTLAANNVLLGNGISALQVVAPSTSGNVLTSNGTTWQSTALPAGSVTVTDDTTTATALYPTFTSATTGSITGVKVTSTKYTFVPTTGALTAPEIVASNGLVVNNATVSTSFTIPTGYNATATGPMTIAGGAVVTIPSGSRWLIL